MWLGVGAGLPAGGPAACARARPVLPGVQLGCALAACAPCTSPPRLLSTCGPLGAWRSNPGLPWLAPAAASQECTAALELEPAYAKALLRRCSTYEQLDDLEHALLDAQKARRGAPAGRVCCRCAALCAGLARCLTGRLDAGTAG